MNQLPKFNYFTDVLIYICDTFNLDHQTMILLRQRLEKAFHSQGKPKKKTPATLMQIALLMLSDFNAGRTVQQVLDRSDKDFIKLARKVKPQ